MLSGDYVRRIPGIDTECRDALAWLCDNGDRYPIGAFTPPLRGTDKTEEKKKFIALSFRMGRKTLRGNGTKIVGVSWYTESQSSSVNESTVTGMQDDICSAITRDVLCAKEYGKLLITSGKDRNVLDSFLETIGPTLLGRGYILLPRLTSGNVSWIKIKKGRKSWTLVYWENMVGCPVSTGLEYARVVGKELYDQRKLARNLYLATVAYSDWLHLTFGVALRPTAGMTALACARRYLDPQMRKWRPEPLLVAMERKGLGYRSGITYAKRFHDTAWRIDVNRQYTAALAGRLPLRASFGRYQPGRNGIYVCRVSCDNEITYPLGVWTGNGFDYHTTWRGRFVSILHSAEFDILRHIGFEIEPVIGFHFTRTFSLDGYVKRLQDVLDTSGKDSPEGQWCKPLGNYVYGKFAQRPDSLDIAYSKDRPGDGWHLFWDQDGNFWDNVWSKETRRVTSSQHIDVAGVIASVARSQTMTMWHYLSGVLGMRVVRCHTDSLTVDQDPSEFIETSDNQIGSWRLESGDVDTIVVGPNAFFDEGGAHIAGVSEPTYEMIERMYDGNVVHVTQTQNTPRYGLQREAKEVTRGYRAKA